MSKPHLRELEEALNRKGWRIVAVHPGDDYRISATWEIQRSSRQASVFIDFDGLAAGRELWLLHSRTVSEGVRLAILPSS